MYPHIDKIPDPQNIYLDTKNIILSDIEPKLDNSVFSANLAAILNFEHEGVVRTHVSSNKNDPWSPKHTFRHQNHLSIWNRTKVTKS